MTKAPFTNKISGMQGMNYWDRLRKLDMFSLERRRELYMITYVWKILNNRVPNISDDVNAIKSTNHIRRGKLCLVSPLNYRSLASVKTLKEKSFAVHGPNLFNSIPREIREFTGTMEGFKVKLDLFLKSVPDKPSLPHYAQSARSNSLLDQISQQRAERIY